MKIADYGKAITSYIESPTTAQKLKSKESAENLLAEVDFSGMTGPQLKILYEKYTGVGAPKDPKELIIELKRLMKNLDQDGVPFATGGRVHLADGSEDIVEPPKSMQVDTTTKGPDLFTIDKFKDKAEIYILALNNRAIPLEDIKSALNKFTKQGLNDGTFTVDEAIKVVQNLKFEVQDRAQKQRLRDVIIEGTGTVKREDFAIGGGAFEGKDLGSREGFSELYGPNIRQSSTGANTFEVTLNRGGKNYYKSFKFEDYGGKEKALKAATEFRDSVKNLPKATGKEAKGRPLGFQVETGQAAEIRRILNQFIAEGKTSFSNDDVRKLADKNLFDTDRSLVTSIDRVKKETPFKDLTFLDARSQKSKADYYTDPNIKKIIKENYRILKQDNLAKLVFPDLPLTTSKSRLGIILSDMADKGEIERLAVGEASEERLGDFDPAPEAVKKAKIGKKRRKKIDILGGKDYEKELYEFKKEVQKQLGLDKVKGGRYDPIDMGHQSSMTQLKALKQRLKPEDLNPQFYKANQFGITKYQGGVKTLESALDKKFYPAQKKLYKQAQKFINAGKEVPADLQNKIIKSNEDIQKFIDKTVKQYPLLKGRVNPITIDPINLNVKRGDNVFRQLGIGLVDKDLGNIKTGSIDDLTIKANLAEQTLKEAIDAGLIDESTGREKLNKFLNVRNPKIEELLKIKGVTTADQAPEPEATKTRKLFEGFGERIKSGASDLKSKMDSSKFLTSKIPGGAVALAPVDFALAMLGGAPVADAAASAGSYLLKDPYLGKAVNIPIALREIASYNDAEEMLAKAAARQEGLKSMLESIPSRFKETINQAKGVEDETEEFVP